MQDTNHHMLTETIPRAGQTSAWLEALARMALTCRLPKDTQLHSSEITTKKSLTGMRVTVLRSTAQEIACAAKENNHAEPNPSVVILHMRGRGRICFDHLEYEFAEGDVTVSNPNATWSVDLRDDFEILLVQLPRERLFSRLGLHRNELPIVLNSTVATKALRPLLQSVSDNLDAMERIDLTSIETVVIELVTSALMGETSTEFEKLSQVQAAMLRRVCAVIEARLRDPKLAISDIADHESISRRYLQRLFELKGTTFTLYLRQRRLEHCRTDLIDPKHVSQNITDIAYRWGFCDGATFSRAFKKKYSVSPRDLRNAIPRVPDKYPNRGRPSRHAGAQDQTGPVYCNVNGVPVGNDTISRQNPGESPKGADSMRSTEGPPHHHLAVSKDTVHWGHIGKRISPKLNVGPDSLVTIETLTHHAYDDYERMIKGDPGAESVYRWTADSKGVERRGAGPMNGSAVGRGAGEGFGVHICTGPIHVRGAEPGDILEVQILDLHPRPSANPEYAGKAFGSNASAWWGFQYNDHIDHADNREVITIYEIDLEAGAEFAQAAYSYRWTPQTDPFGVVHKTIDYPGVPVDHATIEKNHSPRNTRIPARMHFGFMGVAPHEADIVDSIPPGYFGGNVDNWRMTKGSTLYLPVSVPGALFSVGDPHFAQGDGEINGTALEFSLTGVFRLILHKKGQTNKPFLEGLNAPLLETEHEWILHGFSYSNYLRDLGRDAQSEIYSKSSVDLALRNAFRTTRRFLMETYHLGEDEAISVTSLAVDFGITQVADGNWGVHATVSKRIFE